MIEANNPEIDVDELMQKIQEEVARRESFSSLESSEIIAESQATAVNVSYMQALLNNAEFKSQIRTHWPEKFNRFPFNLSGWIQRFALKVYNFLLKEQRAVNFSLIEALRESLALNRQLGEQVTVLQTQLNGLSASLSATDAHLSATDAYLRTRLDTTDTCLNAAEVRLIATDQRVYELAGHLSATDKRLHEVGVQLNTAEQHMYAVGDRVTMTESQIRETSDRVTMAESQLRETNDHLSATEERHFRNDTYLKNDLTQQKRLISLFLEEAQRRLPEPFSQEQVQTFVGEKQHLLDAFYVAFEERFRGSREDIFSRLKVYLPLIEEAKVGTQDSLILDVGCGRGEWLKLLQESGHVARGVDINRVMLEECQSRGLDAIEADVIAYLQSLPDSSLGAVTGFHIIEHLPFPILIELLNETRRVLKSGGLAIFETPNPQNILVSSNNFYIDPTHLNPLPSTLVEFLVEHIGLHSVRILNLNSYEESYKVSGSEVAERFNSYFYGAQDYAVIGYKL
jgi:O-antigen chain-terminating methyltransferase